MKCVSSFNPIQLEVGSEVNNWWQNNWDKALIAIVSIAVSGVVGFFSAILVTNKELSDLGKQVAVLEQQTKNHGKSISNISSNESRITNLSSRFDSIKDSVDLAETRVATIKELTELQRQRTVNELEELLKKYGRLEGQR